MNGITKHAETQSDRFSYWLFVAPLFLLSFFVFTEHLVVVPLSAEISLATGLPLVQSGLLVAIYPLASAFSAFITAPFSDRLGRKKMLIILSVGFGFSTLCFASSTNVPMLLTFRVITGIFGGPIFATVLAYIGDCFEGNLRSKIVTIAMLAFSIASVLSVPIGAWLGDVFVWRMPFYLISGFTLVCCLLIARLKSIPTGAESGSIFSQYVEFLALLKLSKVRKIFTLQFFMLIGLFGFVPNISAWLDTNYGFDSTQIGLCYMQGGIGGMIGNSLSGYFMKKGVKDGLIIFGSMVMCGFLALATQDILPPIFAGFFFAGLMFGGSLRMPALQIVLTELIPINLRGRLMAMSMIVANITMGLGGLWSLPVLHMEDGRLLGMDTIGIIGAGSLLIVPVMVKVLRREIDRSSQTY